MSKRLQILVPELELERLREMARRQGVSVSELVRQALRVVRAERPAADRARKLAAVRAAARHSFPTAEVGDMLAEIERGYAPER